MNLYYWDVPQNAKSEHRGFSSQDRAWVFRFAAERGHDVIAGHANCRPLERWRHVNGTWKRVALVTPRSIVRVPEEHWLFTKRLVNSIEWDAESAVAYGPLKNDGQPLEIARESGTNALAVLATKLGTEVRSILGIRGRVLPGPWASNASSVVRQGTAVHRAVENYYRGKPTP